MYLIKRNQIFQEKSIPSATKSGVIAGLRKSESNKTHGTRNRRRDFSESKKLIGGNKLNNYKFFKSVKTAPEQEAATFFWELTELSLQNA